MENENINIPQQDGRPLDTADAQQTIPAQPYVQPWPENIIISDKTWEMPGAQQVQYEPAKPEVPLWKQIALVIIVFVVVLTMAMHIRSIINKRTEESTTVKATIVLPVYAAPTQESTTASAVTAVQESTSSDANAEDVSEQITSSVSSAASVQHAPSDAQKETTTADNKAPVDSETAKKEVIRYYNDSVNRVKTEAVKVIRNYEKRTHDAEKLVLPSVIQSIGERMLNENMNVETEAAEFATREEIIASFPISKQEFSSRLTAADTESAICTETESEYEIEIRLKPTVDPEPGKGVSNAVDCINVPAIRDTAPEFVTAFSAEYYDCVIRCRADKVTGRIVWINYTTPVIVQLGLDAGFTQFDAQIAFTFEEDYTIIY